MRDDGIFGDDDDAVADIVKLVIKLFRLAGGRDGHVVSDARVFINDGIFDFAVRADAVLEPSGWSFFGSGQSYLAEFDRLEHSQSH